MSFFVARTPFRVSFFGGGTDYPNWYLKEGGAVLSTSINKYCYLTCRYQPPFFANLYRIVWAHIETVSSIREILHPAVREGLLMMGYEGERGVEIHYHGDLPSRTGMGSSSAFANALLLVLSAMRGAPYDKRTLYAKAIELEQERLRENVGSQDQVATAVGGLNVIRFNTDDSIGVEPVDLAPARLAALEDHLMMFYTGSSRIASHVAKNVVSSLADKKIELRHMHALVGEARSILTGGDIADFGRLLDQTWKLKRSIAQGVSNPAVDDIYDTAMRNGALGGKLLGAGGAGFMLFFCPPERQAGLQAALDKLLHVPFRTENEGAVLIQAVSPEDADLQPFPDMDDATRLGISTLQ
jgi:D-glycero-alpha-D-manno-heptose-7-phosphate kinase